MGKTYTEEQSIKDQNIGESSVPWGHGFPWTAKFLGTLFSSPDQLRCFLAWLSFFYRNAYDQEPRAGQHVFICGGVGVGKTFLIRGIVGGLMGGFVEATDYLMGRDQFGSELFHLGLWTIDDGSVGSEPRTQKNFSEMIKRMAANQTFRYHEKFKIPCMVEWFGRVMISLNADEESVRILPNLDISILDKISIYRTVDAREKHFFPEPREMKKILAQELPHLARWLYDHVTPADLRDSVRFGIKPYHEANLVQSAQQSSPNAGFYEILQDFKHNYFNLSNHKADVWEGTTFQLQRMLMERCGGAEALRRFADADTIGKHLSALKNKGVKLDTATNPDGTRVWKIYRD